jgi:lysyl-tRNA synthetase class 2
MVGRTHMADVTTSEQPQEGDLGDLLARRRQELEELRRSGTDPYPHVFERTARTREILDGFREDQPEQQVSLAGRIVSIRRMGKASFCHLADATGRLQVYLRRDDLGETYETFRLLDIGDIVGVAGHIFRTRAGEITVHARSITVLAKTLRPLPIAKEKVDADGVRTVFDPFSDKELRYRQRYADLAVNPEVREVFVRRSRIVSALRRHLDQHGCLEVETPVLQPQYGGAFARPFVTHHNTLDVDLYLRIADELYLKRLVVGGFDAVYEIAKDFRNEGMDRNHNPEFTMLELYVAYRDYLWMMEFVERMVSAVALEVNGTTEIRLADRTVDLAPPWRRITMLEAIRERTGRALGGLDRAALERTCRELDMPVSPADGAGKIIDTIFSETVQPHLHEPTFVMDYPVEMSPLAKRHRTESGLVERFEAFCNGQEICNAFSELTDPLDQRARFEEQMRARAQGADEVQPLDEDYLRALEYGMPPTAGLGIGVDRLVMLLTGRSSIRDVILFPQMRPEG